MFLVGVTSLYTNHCDVKWPVRGCVDHIQRPWITFERFVTTAIARRTNGFVLDDDDAVWDCRFVGGPGK
jgi:hypothetical protein